MKLFVILFDKARCFPLLLSFFFYLAKQVLPQVFVHVSTSSLNVISFQPLPKYNLISPADPPPP